MAAKIARTTRRARRDRVLTAMAAVQDHATEAAALLKAMANDQRLLVLCSLVPGPLAVGQINERVQLSQSALSQHLGVLREAGLVATTRRSQTIYYALAQGPALQVMEVLYKVFCAPSYPNARAKSAKAGPSRPYVRGASRL
jgi:DNA-binding transcriptional ArsR family regulator